MRICGNYFHSLLLCVCKKQQILASRATYLATLSKNPKQLHEPNEKPHLRSLIFKTEGGRHGMPLYNNHCGFMNCLRIRFDFFRWLKGKNENYVQKCILRWWSAIMNRECNQSTLLTSTCHHLFLPILRMSVISEVIWNITIIRTAGSAIRRTCKHLFVCKSKSDWGDKILKTLAEYMPSCFH